MNRYKILFQLKNEQLCSLPPTIKCQVGVIYKPHVVVKAPLTGPLFVFAYKDAAKKFISTYNPEFRNKLQLWLVTGASANWAIGVYKILSYDLLAPKSAENFWASMRTIGQNNIIDTPKGKQIDLAPLEAYYKERIRLLQRKQKNRGCSPFMRREEGVSWLETIKLERRID